MSKRAKGTELNLTGRSMLRFGEEIETVTRKEEAWATVSHIITQGLGMRAGLKDKEDVYVSDSTDRATSGKMEEKTEP